MLFGGVVCGYFGNGGDGIIVFWKFYFLEWCVFDVGLLG